MMVVEADKQSPPNDTFKKLFSSSLANKLERLYLPLKGQRLQLNAMCGYAFASRSITLITKTA
jgi:hypothetical protein